MPQAIAFASVWIASNAAAVVGASVAAQAAIAQAVAIAAYSAIGQTIISVGLSIGLSLAANALQGQPKPAEQQAIIRSAGGTRTLLFGEGKVAGTLAFAGVQEGIFYRVLAQDSGEVSEVIGHYLDDKLVTLNGDGQVLTAPWAGKASIHFRLGEDDPLPYSSLISAFPDLWTNAHLGKGISHVLVELGQDDPKRQADTYPNGINTLYRQIRRGQRTFNPNNLDHDIDDRSTWDWSDNAARIILSYIIHPDGLGLDTSWIKNAMGYWEEAVADCYDGIPLKAGGTEPRYRIWSQVKLNEAPGDVLTRFLAACDGVLFQTPSRGLALRVGKWQDPSVTIDRTHVEVFSKWGRARNVLSAVNRVNAQYISALHDYQEQDADPWVDDDSIAQRGEFVNDIPLLCVPSHSQARRLMKIAYHRANPTWSGSLSNNLRSLSVLGERFVTVDIEDYGINESFEVTGQPDLVVDVGSILRGINLTVASFDSSVYAWDPLTEEGTAPAIPGTIPDPVFPDPDDHFSVDVIVSSVGDITSAALRVTLDDVGFYSWEIEVKDVTSDLSLGVATVARGTFEYITPALANDHDYQVRTRIVASTASGSDWSDWVSVLGASLLSVDTDRALGVDTSTFLGV